MSEQVQEFGKALKQRLSEALGKLPSLDEQLKKMRAPTNKKK